MNRVNADGHDRWPGPEDGTPQAADLSKALLELERSKLSLARAPGDIAARGRVANAVVRYVNELAIADSHHAVGPELDWLIDLTAKHPEDAELAVVAATAIFDHISNLGVAQRFGEAGSELQRLKAFVARYPHEPSVQVRFSSASENLGSMIGWVEDDESPSGVA